MTLEKKYDVYKSIFDCFRFLEQDIMTEHTFRELAGELIQQQQDSYTVLLRLWEEHGYITVLSQPGKQRFIELGPAYERTHYCLM